jgi:hypothetical protein
MKQNVQWRNGNMIEDKRSIMLVSVLDFLETQDMETVMKFLEGDKVSADRSIEEGKTSFLLTQIKDIRVKQMLDNANKFVMQYCIDNYAPSIGVNFKVNKWIREPEFIKWKPGGGLAPHIDGSERIAPPDLTIGCLIYLNDEYLGGEIYFPDYDYLIKPKRGDLIIFPCHFMHEVKLIQNDGKKTCRYTLPLFYTFLCEELKTNV